MYDTVLLYIVHVGVVLYRLDVHVHVYVYGGGQKSILRSTSSY